jgi:hypothetical protein
MSNIYTDQERYNDVNFLVYLGANITEINSNF